MGVTAILLAAGYGTRLYPLTLDRPKALLPLGEGVILDEVLRSLQDVAAIRRRVLVTNHRFVDQFRRWQRSGGHQVQVIDDGTETPETRLGAIRDLELARQAADPTDDLLVLGTDNLFTWPMAAFVASALRVRPRPSLAVADAPSKEAAAQLGVVSRDATGRITAFVEKSPNPPSTEAALAVYYFPAPMCGDITRFVQAGGNADAPGYFIEWLVRRGPVFGIHMDGAWVDIGTRQAYEAAAHEWPVSRSST